MSAPNIILAAGGTGGHMFPASALAAELKAQGFEVHLLTDMVEEMVALHLHYCKQCHVYYYDFIISLCYY